jgi:hypothetical protein
MTIEQSTAVVPPVKNHGSCHRKCSGKQSGNTCQTHGTDVRARARHAENKRDVGYQAITGTENSGARGTALDIAVTTATNGVWRWSATQSRQHPRGDR